MNPLLLGGHGSSGGDQGERSSGRANRTCHHHSPDMIQRLENYFKDCPHPNENQRRELGRELGLEPTQIKFWFQNKRSRSKACNKRADNESLQAEYERIRCENLSMRESLKNMLCPTCEGTANVSEHKAKILQNLKLENAMLKEEYEKRVAFLAQHLTKPFPEAQVSLSETLLNKPGGIFITNETDGSVIDPDHVYMTNSGMEMEKANMIETIGCAMNELTKLFKVNEPLWIKSSYTHKYLLDYKACDSSLLHPNHISNAHFESSKEFALVPMTALHLVDMLLDSEKYENFFPTIINRAKTIYILDNGLPANRDECKQLMYQKIHSLSPLVKPREFYFLRCSRKLAQGIWIVGDVSYIVSNGFLSPYMSWRKPSGCMIEDKPNGFSKVTWIEHVEVDDSQTHSFYQYLLSSGSVYGAGRWVSTLERMCRRNNVEQRNNIDVNELGEGYKGIMQLSHRMIKEFCSMLCMLGSSNSLQLSGPSDGEVQANFHVSIGEGQPRGMVVNVVASFRLPIPKDDIFFVLSCEKTRIQWDVLSRGYPVERVTSISSGIDPRNSISILRTLSLTESNVITLQETCVDGLHSFIIYAPIDYSNLKTSMRGDQSITTIYPSGFVISPDGYCPEIIEGDSNDRDNRRSDHSLVTMALQILTACPSSSSGQLNEETMGLIRTIISTTVQKIRVVLNCTA